MAVAKQKPQDVFVWEGKNQKGSVVKGEATGASITLVKADLRRQGITPNKVRKKPKPLLGGGKKAITPKDISVFARQLATMMSAGVPIVQAFDIVGKGHENPSMRELILAIKGDVEGGGTMYEALRKHPKHFDDLFCNLVNAGEQGGVLETLLDKIATYKEKTESLKGKIKKALFYPTAVMVVAMIVSIILLVFVVPQFATIFESFGADLPAFTQMVINLSEFMQAYWYLFIGGMVGAFFAIKQGKQKSRKFAEFLDRLMLQIPVMGEIIEKAAIARFARTLATMFAAGVPLVEALSSVAGATGNIVFSSAVERMREDVSGGTQLQTAMKTQGVFPNMVVQMVAIGEESGSIDTMLLKVADFYEEEVDNLVDSMSALLEPFIMAILGVLVGGLVVAMYLPIFKLGAVV